MTNWLKMIARLFIVSILVLFSSWAKAEDIESRILQFALDSCQSWNELPQPVLFPFDDAVFQEVPIEVRGVEIGRRFSYELEDKATVDLDVIQRSSVPSQFVLKIVNRLGQPDLFVSISPECDFSLARRIVYRNERASYVDYLDDALTPAGQRDLLNPDLGELVRGIDHGNKVRVAMIDSGVNYQLDAIAEHLGAGENGTLLGYDFWEMDSLPFDTHFSRSPFFVQRHGTKTASLLLKEAPDILLIPYRYPRPDMSRLKELVEHAYGLGVRIIGMPLGSNRYEDWVDFADAARTHPDVLFIASAGNNGRDIDMTPVYPAAMELDNMIVVSSADDGGYPANGSNWGRLSVDYLVPAENQAVLDFDGTQTQASGSSYAVSRITALAARLKFRHPEWQVDQIKQSIKGFSVKGETGKYVTTGYIADPLSDTAEVKFVETAGMAEDQSINRRKISLDIVILDSQWDLPFIREALEKADEIFRQCDISIRVERTLLFEGSDYLRDLSTGGAKTLFDTLEGDNIKLVFARDTRMQIQFDGEAFGEANTRSRPWLKDSVWLTHGISDPEIAIAHELFHVLANSGEHSDLDGNLMNDRTDQKNRQLDPYQCEQIL